MTLTKPAKLLTWILLWKAPPRASLFTKKSQFTSSLQVRRERNTPYFCNSHTSYLGKQDRFERTKHELASKQLPKEAKKKIIKEKKRKKAVGRGISLTHKNFQPLASPQQNSKPSNPGFRLLSRLSLNKLQPFFPPFLLLYCFTPNIHLSGSISRRVWRAYSIDRSSLI